MPGSTAAVLVFFVCFNRKRNVFVAEETSDLHKRELLGDDWNYMPPILVPFSVKRITTQILVTEKLNGRNDFVLRGFACDINRPSKKLPVQI